jgi:hypothetical protein
MEKEIRMNTLTIICSTVVIVLVYDLWYSIKADLKGGSGTENGNPDHKNSVPARKITLSEIAKLWMDPDQKG